MDYTHPIISDFLRKYTENVFVNDHVAPYKCLITPCSDEAGQRVEAFLSMSKVKYDTRPGGYAMVKNADVTDIVFELGQNQAIDVTAWEMTKDKQRSIDLNNLDLRVARYEQRLALDQLKTKIINVELGVVTNKIDKSQKKYVFFYFPQNEVEIETAKSLLEKINISTERKVVTIDSNQLTVLRCPTENISNETISILGQLEDAVKERQKKLQDIQMSRSNGARRI